MLTPSHHLLLIGVLSLAACAHVADSNDPTALEKSEPQRAGSTPETPGPIFGPMTLRGYMAIGHEVRSFTPCSAEVMYWLVDQTDGDLRAVYESLASQPYQPIFTVVEGSFGPGLLEGFGADYSGQVIVDRVRRAEAEGHGCNEDLEGLEFRAQGNEPFWNAEITSETIRFTEFGGSAPTSWPLERATERDGNWDYRASAHGDNSTIQVQIHEARCRDSMSGAYFSFIADVALGARTFRGCAVRGF